MEDGESSSKNIILGIVTVGVLIAVVFFVIIPLFTGGGDVPEAPPPVPPSVAVLNGCGVSGIASQMSDFLTANEITVVETGNADNANYMKTIVVGKDSLGENARRVAELIGVRNLTYDFDPAAPANVIIILGRDYKLFRPYNPEAP